MSYRIDLSISVGSKAQICPAAPEGQGWERLAFSILSDWTGEALKRFLIWGLHIR